jgi:ATP-binding cassette, subfamily B, vacuolar membrane transporter HMT1/ACLQ
MDGHAEQAFANGSLKKWEKRTAKLYNYTQAACWGLVVIVLISANVASVGVMEESLETSNNSAGGISDEYDDAARLLQYTQFAYPLILLFVFIAAFTGYSIAASSAAKKHAGRYSGSSTPDSQQNGQNGHATGPSRAVKVTLPVVELNPLRKAVIQWAVIGVLATFVGNAANVIIHALYFRKEHWWCGEAPVVSVLL